MDNNQNNFNQPNGQNDGWSYDNGQFYTPVPPIDSNAMQANKSAIASQTLGIVGLVLSIIGCPLISLIIGIIAISQAATAKKLLVKEPSEASVGRVCGIIAIVLSILSMIPLIIAYIFFINLIV